MKKRKALTLIEIILAMLILGVVAVVFLTIFNTSNRNIVSTGGKTKVLYEIQEQVDAKIKKVEDSQYTKSEETINGVMITIKYLEDKEKNIKVVIDGVSTQNIPGKLITGEKDEIKITTFVPDKSEGE